MRAFWSTRGMQADSTIDKEKQRQQAQDDVREEMEEHRRERDEVADEDAGNEADLAPEVERLDPQSVPGLYPEFDAEEQPEEGDDSWYIDTSYAQSEAATVPLWQRRAAENLGQQTVDPDMLLKGSVLDLCCTMLREDGEVAVLDVSDRCDWTSKMVVARATSTRHMRAMGERMLKTIKERYRLTDSSRPIRVDGRESDDWVVVDMGSFIVHIMTPEAHQTYDLESL
ncbi:hypothetical protein GGF43_002571 [Coemansia sp. RSA 2618]|nr:hypothetical protein GGF43_002571 [Coemansia sp. RSA 2618]